MTKKNLTDRFSEAFSELEEKNAYMCESCGEKHVDISTHDRFSEAVSELEEKNAFICKSCGGKMVMHGEDSGRELKTEDVGRLSELDKKWAKTAEAINSDPSPSGA